MQVNLLTRYISFPLLFISPNGEENSGIKCSCYSTAERKYYANRPRSVQHSFTDSISGSHSAVFLRTSIDLPASPTGFTPAQNAGPEESISAISPSQPGSFFCQNSSVSPFCTLRIPAIFKAKNNILQVWKDVGDAIGSVAVCAIDSAPVSS